MSAATEAKANRLLDDGCVHKVDGLPRGFMVDGDHGTYKVTVGRYTTWCGCPRGPVMQAGSECSHGTAAVRLFEREHGGSRL